MLYSCVTFQYPRRRKTWLHPWDTEFNKLKYRENGYSLKKQGTKQKKHQNFNNKEIGILNFMSRSLYQQQQN